MPEFLIITLTILMSGFFSGSEMAFVSANRLNLKLNPEKYGIRTSSLAFFSENPERFSYHYTGRK
jgi:putative hemolysin